MMACRCIDHVHIVKCKSCLETENHKLREENRQLWVIVNEVETDAEMASWKEQDTMHYAIQDIVDGYVARMIKKLTEEGV